MANYGRRARRHFGSGGPGGKSTPPERLQRKLDNAWKEFHGMKSSYRKKETTKEDVEKALEKLKRIQRRVGVWMHLSDLELLGWEPDTDGE